MRPAPLSMSVVTSVVTSVLVTACSPLRSPPPLPAASWPAGRALTRSELAADLDSMLAMIERVHPNPYTVVTRDSLRTARDSIVSQFPESAPRIDAWSSYAKLVAMIGDGHTSVPLPGDEVLRQMANGGLLLPTRTITTDSATLLIAVYRASDSILKRGDEMLSINGRPADSLVRAFAAEIGGETAYWRNQLVARQFESLLMLNGVRAPFTIDVRSVGAIEPHRVTLPGMSRDSLAAADRRVASPPFTTSRTANFTFRMLPDGVGYLNLVSLSGDRARFREDLATVFTELHADSATALIVDLRQNGGGNTQLGDDLLAHISNREYRMSSAKRWKMSREYRTYLKSYLRPPLNHLPVAKVSSMGRRLFSGPDGTIVSLDEKPEGHDKLDPTFAGPVCVLIGSGTFSSAVDLADAIKTYRLATLIGEETGGRPNSFGEVYVFRTPIAGFLVSVSSAEFVRANGDTTDHRGVMPHIEVRRTAADLSLGRDPVLERARSCPALQ